MHQGFFGIDAGADTEHGLMTYGRRYGVFQIVEDRGFSAMRRQGQANALGVDIVFGGGLKGVSLTRGCELGGDLVPVDLSQTEESPLSNNKTPSNPCT